jgi:hypothetical protein
VHKEHELFKLNSPLEKHMLDAEPTGWFVSFFCRGRANQERLRFAMRGAGARIEALLGPGPLGSWPYSLEVGHSRICQLSPRFKPLAKLAVPLSHVSSRRHLHRFYQ